MLNIKNRETEAAVRKLARRLDTSLTEAVAIAVCHEIERLNGDRQRYLEHLRTGAQEVRAELSPDEWLDVNALYDDNGVPR